MHVKLNGYVKAEVELCQLQNIFRSFMSVKIFYCVAGCPWLVLDSDAKQRIQYNDLNMTSLFNVNSISNCIKFKYIGLYFI